MQSMETDLPYFDWHETCRSSGALKMVKSYAHFRHHAELSASRESHRREMVNNGGGDRAIDNALVMYFPS
jgi:hypothetical protein